MDCIRRRGLGGEVEDGALTEWHQRSYERGPTELPNSFHHVKTHKKTETQMRVPMGPAGTLDFEPPEL